MTRDDALKHLAFRQMAIDAITDAHRYDWSFQGFGMLRAYLTADKSVRLHIWLPSRATPNVSLVHTHPWHFTSHLLSGRIQNVRLVQSDGFEAAVPYVRAPILCGAGGGIDLDGKRVIDLKQSKVDMLSATDPSACVYHQDKTEIHASYPSECAVTVVERIVPAGDSADHAFVYWRADEEWVSAEPKPVDHQDFLGEMARAKLGVLNIKHDASALLIHAKG